MCIRLSTSISDGGCARRLYLWWSITRDCCSIYDLHLHQVTDDTTSDPKYRSANSSLLSVHTLRILPKIPLKQTLIDYCAKETLSSASVSTCVGSLEEVELRLADGSTVSSILLVNWHVHGVLSHRKCLWQINRKNSLFYGILTFLCEEG